MPAYASSFPGRREDGYLAAQEPSGGATGVDHSAREVKARDKI